MSKQARARRPHSFYARHGKRWLDVAGAAGGLLFLSPVIAALGLLVRLKLGKPAFFRQQRPGRDGRTFEIIKLRTMTDRRDAGGKLLPDSERLTAFGSFLRSCSLDELPELWNVLRGEMSLVGPRPLKVAYLDRYSPGQARRHEVLPGITGWAQVNGRNALSWGKKFQLDVWYVDRVSLLLDATILGLTVMRVFQRQGISQEGHATMAEFMGNN